MTKKFHHIAIVVKDLEDKIPFFCDVYNADLLGPIYFDKNQLVKVQFIQSSDIKIELLEPMNSKSPIFTAQSDVALRIHVDRAVRHYFAQLQGEQPSQVYDMVLAEMEKPLLSVVLEYTRGNQTRAAEILGLNRGTLRKKLKAHGLMSE